MDWKIYKSMKKMSKAEIEIHMRNIYNEGFKKGFKEGVDSSQKADFKIELVQLLENIKGVGPKTKEKILRACKER